VAQSSRATALCLFQEVSQQSPRRIGALLFTVTGTPQELSSTEQKQPGTVLNMDSCPCTSTPISEPKTSGVFSRPFHTGQEFVELRKRRQITIPFRANQYHLKLSLPSPWNSREALLSYHCW
jgi:hypothetical protein